MYRIVEYVQWRPGFIDPTTPQPEKKSERFDGAWDEISKQVRDFLSSGATEGKGGVYPRTQISDETRREHEPALEPNPKFLPCDEYPLTAH